MLRYTVLAVLLSCSSLCSGESYGHGESGGGEHYGHSHHVTSPVHTTHHVSYHKMPSTGHVQSTHVDVPPNVVPISFTFHSKSSPIHVNQHHEGEKGSHQESHSVDEPHKLKHSVIKPIYQEIHETIVPHRKIIQEVKPVHEEIKTIVAQKHGHGEHHYGHKESSGGHYEHKHYEPKHY